MTRKPSNLISCSHSVPEDVGALLGRHGGMKPAGKVRDDMPGHNLQARAESSRERACHNAKKPLRVKVGAGEGLPVQVLDIAYSRGSSRNRQSVMELLGAQYLDHKFVSRIAGLQVSAFSGRSRHAIA